MVRKPFSKKIPRFKTRFKRGGMDMKFIIRNWRAINETPIKKAGLLIRTIMRGSIRRARFLKRKGVLSTTPSSPGKPPRARTGIKPGAKTQSKNLPFKKILSIPFADGTKAVIGHKRLMHIKQQDPRKTPMEAHEFGRKVRIRTKARKGNRSKARTEKQRRAARKLYLAGKLKHKEKDKWTTKVVRMPKRPFARPALMKGRRKLGQFWRGMVNKSTIRRRKFKT